MKVERTGLAEYWYFEYDQVGNRTVIQRETDVQTSAYDENNQLESATGGGTLRVGGVLDEPGTAAVNGMPARMLEGNVFEATIETSVGVTTFTVQATDLSGNTVSQTYQVVVTGADASYGYDANGNLIAKTEGGSTWGYEWNAKNELVRVTRDGTEVATFSYDPLGRRVEKAAGGLIHNYLYDGLDILRGTVTDGDSSSTYLYLHGPGVDEPLAREHGVSGTLDFYHGDRLGSVVMMTDQLGTVVHSARYDAWGNLEVGADQDGYAFTGREWDPEIKLYYFRARYYDPRTGRFVSQDPIGFEGGLNFFEYVFSNPATLIDPFGLDVQICHRPMRGMPNVSHAYVYSTRAKVGYGLGPRGVWKWVTPWVPVPGVVEPDSPVDENGNQKPDNTCNTVETSKCVERCILRTFYEDSRKPPKYNLGKYQCNDYADDIILKCRLVCGP